MFTGELQRAGGLMIWSDEAVVIDIVPPHRSTIRWVLLRAVRTGTAWSAVTLALAQSRSSRAGLRLRLSGQGLVRMAWVRARCLRDADQIRLPPSAWPSHCRPRVGDALRSMGLRVPGVLGDLATTRPGWGPRQATPVKEPVRIPSRPRPDVAFEP